MTRLSFLAGGGTWSFDGDPSPDEWSNPESQFADWMRARGFFPTQDDETDPVLKRQFGCYMGLDGVYGDDLIWKGCAEHFALRLERCPDALAAVHSHMGNVALEAAKIVPIQFLLTVSTPVQPQMEALGRELLAQNRIGFWWHLHAKGGFLADKIQWLGSVKLFDRYFNIPRRFYNIQSPRLQTFAVPGVDHSKSLHEYWAFQRAFDETGLLACIREVMTAAKGAAV